MADKQIIIINDETERTVEVKIGRTSIASANYDEHGWAGLELISDMAKKIGKALSVPVVER